jgi:hypothetical protein
MADKEDTLEYRVDVGPKYTWTVYDDDDVCIEDGMCDTFDKADLEGARALRRIRAARQK